MENIQQLQAAFYPLASAATFKVANAPTHTGFIIRNNGYTIRRVCQQPEEKGWRLTFNCWEPVGNNCNGLPVTISP